MANRPETLKRYAESHKEQIRASKKKYRDAHKEQMKAYREKNREKLLAAMKISSKAYYENNKEKVREYEKAYQRSRKEMFLDMYGRSCSCCEETISAFLTIEHKNGQKKISRETGAVAYRKAIKEYRPDLYEVLCWNCNCAKGHLGYCPHTLLLDIPAKQLDEKIKELVNG